MKALSDSADTPTRQVASNSDLSELASLRDFLPEFGVSNLTRKKLFKHLRLIPYDVLVVLFVGQIMLPIWAALLLVAVNVGTWWCYHRIPQFLRTVSGPDGDGILISGPIVERFAQFIHSCGVHHRAHYGLMFAMMAGFHAAMTGQLWSLELSPAAMMTMAWLSYAALFAVDFIMYWISLRTLQQLRKDKLREANRYTAELKRSNEELEQFAYIASHDLRSPLRSIINLSNWIEQDIGKTCSADTREHLRLLKSRTERMDNLLNDLLRYARIGSEETSRETIVLGELAQEIFDSLHSNDKMTLEIRGGETEIEDYRITFLLMLSNLIANAIKHNKRDSGHIWVSFERDKTALNIIVEDDGPGIPEAYRSKVFDVFSTLDRRDTKEASGMGLAIVRKIVLHKKGRISLDNNDLGGARFTIRLPILKDGL